MLQCPACDTTLNQDFGMVTCQNCGAVLIVEMSGDVRMNTNNEYNTPDEPDAMISKSIHHQDSPPDQASEQAMETIGETDSEKNQWEDIGQYTEGPSTTEIPDNDAGFDSQQDDFENHDNAIQDPESHFQENFFESQIPGEKESSDETIRTRIDGSMVPEEGDFIPSQETQGFLSSEETINSPTKEVLTTEPQEQQSFLEQNIEEPVNPTDTDTVSVTSRPNSKPLDVTEFADSERSNLDEGEYLYDLTIDRLDSKDLREALKYVLMDEKLKINEHGFLKKIKNGCVCIPNLNPVKAKIIVEQLQYYDLNIHWKQKRVVMEEALHEEEVSSKETENE